MRDAVDQAIAAAAQPLQQRFRAQVALGGPDRVAAFDLPADLTDEELLGLISGLARELRAQIATQRAQGPRPRLLVPA